MTKINVLHFSTHNEECGIAKYNEQIIDAMQKEVPDVNNVFFEVSPNTTKNLGEAEFQEILNKLLDQAKNFDILHIQHELSFFKHEELNKIIKAMDQLNKKTVVTVHTAPDVQLQPENFGGLSPRSVLKRFRAKRRNQEFINRYYRPLKNATLVLVLNNATRESITRLGLSGITISIFRHHIPNNIPFDMTTKEIATNLNSKSGDKILCTVGFLSKSKGVNHAVQALNYLPKEYKLAIIGGSHPRGETHSYYDEIADLILHYKLQDRVYITGYIKDDKKLNALVRECDICLYPFDAGYYDYVSSGSMSIAVANHKAIITYPTRAFKEVNSQNKILTICDTPNYYELAKEIKSLNIEDSVEIVKNFAFRNSANEKAKELAIVYDSLLK